MKKYIIGIKRILESIYKKATCPPYIREQVLLRTVLAKDCVVNGNCKNCGCSYFGIADKRFIDVACDKFYENKSDYCYGEFMNKKTWEEYKSKLLWDFFVEQAMLIEKEAKSVREERYKKYGYFKKHWTKVNEYFN